MSPDNKLSMEEWLEKYPPSRKDLGDREPRRKPNRSKSPYLDDLKKEEPRKTVDLHGLTGVEAREIINRELLVSRKAGLRKIRIIHGKGLHSDTGPVLRGVVMEILSSSDHVLMYGNEPRNRGGEGATWVILRA